MKAILKKLIIIAGLALCATSSYAEIQFQVIYKNNSTNHNFYFNNDLGSNAAITMKDDCEYDKHTNQPYKCFYAGHGYVHSGGLDYFNTSLTSSIFSAGAKKVALLYIPDQNNSDLYKKVAFMLWAPVVGSEEWKLGSMYMNDIMSENGYYHGYNYSFPSVSINQYAAYTIEITLENNNQLTIKTYDEYNYPNLHDPDDHTKIGNPMNVQYIDTNYVAGVWVDSTQLPEAEMTAVNPNAASKQIQAPQGTYNFGEWKKGSEYPVIWSPKESHPFVTYNGKGYVACAADTKANDIPGQSAAWTEINQNDKLATVCGAVNRSTKKQSVVPTTGGASLSFW